jgi:hypothetical protein
LLAFISPSEAMTAAVQEMGYESALTMLQTEGLAGSMQLLEDYTGGSADEIAKLFTNIRSRRGAMLLMNGDLDEMIDSMYEAQGAGEQLSAMELALEEQTKSTSFAIDVVQASFDVMGQELVQSFLPIIRQVAFFLADLAQIVIALPQPVKDFIGTVIAVAGAFMTAVGAVALFMALFGPILPLLIALAAAATALAIPIAALAAIFSTFGFRDAVQGFSDIVDALDVPFLDHFTNSVERGAEAWERFTGLIQTGTGFTQLDGFALSLGKLGAAIIAFADSTSGLDILDGPLGDLGQFLKDLAGPLDTFLDIWRELNKEGTESDTTADFGVPDVFDDGDFKQTHSRITMFTRAWDGMVESLHETFPNQAPLINQINAAVKGLIGTVSAAMAGEWSVAWESFQGAMGHALDAARTIMGNVQDAIMDGFDAINWDAVYDALGSAFDAAFDNIVQGIEWVANVAAPAVFGWLYDNSGAIWEGIKTIGGWVFDRFTEVVNWTIDVAIPEIIGAGEAILNNVKAWLIGKLSGGTAGGWASGSVSGVGNVGEISLGSVFVDWAIDVAIPEITGAGEDAWNNIKGWLAGKMQGGAAGGWASGSVSGVGADGANIDIGTLTASWAINVLEPTLTGWISGAASWLQGKLQSYVSGAGGASGYSEGIGGTRGGIGGGTMATLAGWAIEVLEPLAQLAPGDITSAVQKAVTAAGQIKATTEDVLIAASGADVEDGAGLKAAIDASVQEEIGTWRSIADVLVDINASLGDINFGGGGGTGGAAGGVGGLDMIDIMIQELIGEPLTVTKVIDILIDITDPGTLQTDEILAGLELISSAIDAVATWWNTPEKWSKVIDLWIEFNLPDALLTVLGYLDDIAAFLPEKQAAAVAGLLDYANGVKEAVAEVEKANQDAATAMSEWDPRQFRPNTSPSNYGHQSSPSFSQLNVSQPETKFDAFDQPLFNMQDPVKSAVGDATSVWQTSSRGLVTAVQQTGQQITQDFQRGFGAELPRTTFVAAQDTSRQFGTGLTGMGQAATRESGAANTAMGTGLLGMVATAGTNAASTTSSLGVGLAGMPGISGQMGGQAESSLRSGIAPMPIAGGVAGRDTTANVRGGLAPMPGQVGAIANAAGSSFSSGIIRGFVEAAIAANTGAAAIRAAANSIGDLYGVGYGVGSSLGAGVAAGIWSQVGAVSAASAALASAAAAGAQARGQISSPSKLMRDQVGIPLAQGVIEGIESQQGQVYAAMGAFVDERTGAYTLPKSKVVAINNNNYFILEPEAWMEVQRDSKMAASQLREMNSKARLRTRSKPQLSKTA